MADEPEVEQTETEQPPEPGTVFSMDVIMMDLWIAGLPNNPSRFICERWIESADRDIYAETVESRGYDPLEKIAQRLTAERFG